MPLIIKRNKNTEANSKEELVQDTAITSTNKPKKQDKKEIDSTPKPFNPSDVEIGAELTIKGKVYETKFTEDYRGKNITVFAPKSQLLIKTVFYPKDPNKFNLEKGDCIIGIAKHRGNGFFEFVTDPLVEIATDKESIIKFIEKCVNSRNFREQKSKELYDKMRSLSDGEDSSDVINLFNDISVKYIKNTLDINYPLTHKISPGYIEQGKFLALIGSWHEDRIVRQLLLLGLTKDEMSIACYLHMIELEKLYERCRDNPNSICNLSEQTIYNIIARTERYPTAIQNRCGIIIRTLYENLNKRKYNCTSPSMLRKLDNKWEDLLPVLEAEYDVVYDKKWDRVYIKKIYVIETTVADDFKKLVLSDPLVQYYYAYNEYPEINQKGNLVVDNKLYSYDREEVLIEDPRIIHEQRTAIQAAIDHKISIITGGAGVGKTTVINSIVKCLKHRETKFFLCSFTGKAVSRVKELVSNADAYTIHRLISHISKTGKDGDIPSHIVIDEASMVPLGLFYRLLEVIKEAFGTDNFPKLTFIGDSNQLSPISYGDLFKSMCDSGIIPTYVLLFNHRVSENPEDGIVINATSMINNLYNCKTTPEIFNFRMAPNFMMIDYNIDALFNFIQQMYEEQVPKEDFKILSPYVKDLDVINKKVQEIYLFDKRHVTDSRNKKWYIDDLVVMQCNNYEIGVFNGEIGRIVKISETCVSVSFSPTKVADFAVEPPKRGRYIERNKFAYDEAIGDKEKGRDDEILSVLSLKHGYATTVHTSQGSEYKKIIFWIPYDVNTSGFFLNCNLTYTAITRARESFIAFGNLTAILESTKFGLPYRNERLTNRLKDNMKKIDKITFVDQDLDITKLPKLFLSDSKQAYGFDSSDDEFDDY